jgi:hypothetical protein
VAVHRLVTRCPWCGRANNGHSNIDHRDAQLPVAGSAAMCAACHGVGVFEQGRGGLVLRKPTPQEAAEMLRDPEFRQAIRQAAQACPLGGVRRVL